MNGPRELGNVGRRLHHAGAAAVLWPCKGPRGGLDAGEHATTGLTHPAAAAAAQCWRPSPGRRPGRLYWQPAPPARPPCTPPRAAAPPGAPGPATHSRGLKCWSAFSQHEGSGGLAACAHHRPVQLRGVRPISSIGRPDQTCCSSRQIRRQEGDERKVCPAVE